VEVKENRPVRVRVFWTKNLVFIRPLEELPAEAGAKVTWGVVRLIVSGVCRVPFTNELVRRQAGIILFRFLEVVESLQGAPISVKKVAETNSILPAGQSPGEDRDEHTIKAFLLVLWVMQVCIIVANSKTAVKFLSGVDTLDELIDAHLVQRVVEVRSSVLCPRSPHAKVSIHPNHVNLVPNTLLQERIVEDCTGVRLFGKGIDDVAIPNIEGSTILPFDRAWSFILTKYITA